MNFIYNLFGNSNVITPQEALQLAKTQKSIKQDKTYQNCMQDIRLSASLGHFETNYHTQDKHIIDTLKKQGYHVELTKYSEHEYNYGFTESVTREGIKISWNV